ncbi:MAG: penicillin-binding protein activator [Gammaproteobacteria bacterium]|nr:penicillin-binding protein activator [Gammaproteobacteria bacterium]
MTFLAMIAVRRSLVVLLTLMLASCSPNTRQIASVERAAALAERGDHAAAAREYEAVAAATAESLLANAALLPAAREWLQAANPGAAALALARLLPPLDELQIFDRDLLGAEIALQHGDSARGWELLAALRAPSGPARIDAYHALRQQLALATNRPLQAVRSQVERETLATDPGRVAQLRRRFLAELQATVERGVTLDPRLAGRDTLASGWLEAAPLAARAARAPIAANAGITAVWRKRYPNHPAAAALAMIGQLPTPQPLLAMANNPRPAAAPAALRDSEASAAPLTPVGRPLPRATHVAALLPLSGRNASAGAQLRDGILAAQFAEPEASRTPVRFYDTARQSVTEAMVAATRAGAVFIIGPLVREEMVAAATIAAQAGAPPTLTLNFFPADHPVPPTVKQFGLSPEDEARAVAQRALVEGRRRAVVLAPAGDWGNRVLAAFRETLEAGGGVILASESLSGREVGPVLQAALRVDDSIARHRRIQTVLDTPLAFQSRRRSDIDFVFTPGQATALRQWRPQLRFHGGGDLPAYATADAWDGRAGAELAGLIFPDMDWSLAAEAPAVAALRADTSAAFGDSNGRGRLYALGHDAWLLQSALRAGKTLTAEAPLVGATGQLSIDATGRVQRSLRWAEIGASGLRLLDADPRKKSGGD